MADTNDTDYAAQITTQLHPYIEFLRERWQEFCEMVEKNAKRLARHQEEYLGDVERVTKKYPNSFFPDLDEYHRVKAAGNKKKIRQLEKIAGQNKAESDQIFSRAKKRREKAQDEGWAVWGMNYDTQYLKLPYGNRKFYIPPNVDVVNPLLWVLDKKGNPREIKPEESRLCDYAILCYVHDQKISTGRQRIYSLGTYKGKYFNCDGFYYRTEYTWSKESLRQAYNNVKPHLDAWLQKQEKAKAPPSGKAPSGKTDGPKEATLSEPLSKPLFPKQWAEIYGVSKRTIQRKKENGTLLFVEFSARKWQLPLSQLPAEYLQKYQRITSPSKS